MPDSLVSSGRVRAGQGLSFGGGFVSHRPLVTVHLWSGLRSLAGDQEVVKVRAATVGQMLDALVAEIPALEEPIEAGVSVSIDGKIFAQGLTQPVTEDNEIYLLQRIKGG